MKFSNDKLQQYAAAIDGVLVLSCVVTAATFAIGGMGLVWAHFGITMVVVTGCLAGAIGWWLAWLASAFTRLIVQACLAIGEIASRGQLVGMAANASPTPIAGSSGGSTEQTEVAGATVASVAAGDPSIPQCPSCGVRYRGVRPCRCPPVPA